MNKQREIANPHRNKPNGAKPYKTPEKLSKSSGNSN